MKNKVELKEVARCKKVLEHYKTQGEYCRNLLLFSDHKNSSSDRKEFFDCLDELTRMKKEVYKCL